MTIGAALLLIAVGAILRFAVNTVTVWGIQVHTIGDILMIIGVVGLVLWMVIWAPWARARRTTVFPAPSGRRSGRRTDTSWGTTARYHPADYTAEYPTQEYPPGDPRYPSGRRGRLVARYRASGCRRKGHAGSRSSDDQDRGPPAIAGIAGDPRSWQRRQGANATGQGQSAVRPTSAAGALG